MGPVTAARVAGRHGPRGFTLIELLVVVVIAGIALSVVAISMAPTADRRLHLDAERLAALLQAAQEEAQLTGTSIVWQASRSGYAFLKRTGETYATLDDEFLRPRKWEAEMTAIDGGTDQAAPAPDAPQALPQAMPALPAGAERAPGQFAELPFSREPLGLPFTVHLSSGARVVTLHGDALGRITVSP